jgi:TatD DNase family protein
MIRKVSFWRNQGHHGAAGAAAFLFPAREVSDNLPWSVLLSIWGFVFLDHKSRHSGKIREVTMNNPHEVSPFPLVDTHCHLTMPPLSTDLEEVLSRAHSRSVKSIIVPAYDHLSWPDVLAVSGRTGVHPALGIHPWVSDQWPAGVSLKQALADAISAANTRVVAIGEIGLDTISEMQPPLEIQTAILETQLELAVDLDLPVILHCRGVFGELARAIDHHGGKIRGVLHAFSRGPELVQRFHGAGLHFGLGGGVTRENARKVRRGAKVIPLNRIVLETDAPSIGIQNVRPENTEPHHVADVAVALAELRGEELATIARETTGNAIKLFNF